MKRFELENSRPILIPLQSGLLKQNSNPVNPVKNTEIKLYQKIINTAIYLLTQTRPDINFPIQWLSKFLQKPLQTHLNINKNLFKFTNGIEDLSISYSRKGLTNGLQPIRYYDNDFADDKKSSKSTYNYVFKFAESPIS